MKYIVEVNALGNPKDIGWVDIGEFSSLKEACKVVSLDLRIDFLDYRIKYNNIIINFKHIY